jgi:hypothetical protein
MKKIMSLLVLLVIFVSCKEEKKQDTTTKPVVEKPEERDINDFLVFENLLMEQNIEEAEYKNVQFTKEGVLFGGTKEKHSYVKIPYNNLDLTNGFNVSFSFLTTSDDGRFPQGLVTLMDKFSSPAKAPFLLYFPANKVSGTFGEQCLWAESYDRNNGYSRAYYDSFQLNANKTYFVSANFNENKIEIYVNSELYASFDQIEPHSLKVEHILIGAVPIGPDFNNFFQGTVHGLKIFDEALSETEIIEVYNEQPYLGDEVE